MRDFYLRGDIQKNTVSLMMEVIWLPKLFRSNNIIQQKIHNILYSEPEDISNKHHKYYEIIKMIIENTEPTVSRFRTEAACPLCGSTPQSYYSNQGYTHPEGLKRHLEGYGNMMQCLIMSLIWELTLYHNKK